MLELAIAGRPQFALSDLDFASDTPAYTAELLARLRAALQPADDLYFIMGEDSLRDFPCWREPERIARLARLAVVTRPRVKVDIASVVRAVPALAAGSPVSRSPRSILPPTIFAPASLLAGLSPTRCRGPSKNISTGTVSTTRRQWSDGYVAGHDD